MSNEASPLLELANSGADLGQVFDQMKEQRANVPLDYTEVLPEEPREEPSGTISAAVPQEDTTIIERSYQNPDGEPAAVAVSKERAADDLQKLRKSEAEIAADARNRQFADEIDKLRLPDAQAASPEQPQVQEQQPQQPAQQPQTGQEAYQELSELFQKRPELIQAFETQRQADIAQGQQALAQAAEYIQANGRIAAASVFSHFPEMQQLVAMNPQQQQAAMAMFAQSNPERYQALQKEIQGIQQVLQADAQVRQVAAQRDAQRYAQEWHRFAGAEDAKFTQRNPEMANSQQAAAITNKAANYLRSIGFSDGDMHRAYNGEGTVSFRDHRTQQLIMDAMRYREAVAGVPQAKRNTPVRVMKPGPAGTIATQEDIDMRALSNQLKGATGNAAARLGAQIIAERRARGGR